jgi:hypothetical protein
MAAGSTYTPIATAQGTGSSGTIQFNSIPSTYTDLVLVSNLETSTSANLYYQYNGSSSSIYSDTTIYGDGSSTGTYGRTNQTVHYISYFSSSGQRLAVISNFQNYSNTTTFKSILTRASNASFELNEVIGLWRSTSAISSITLNLNNSANFTSSSFFTLYGITAA